MRSFAGLGRALLVVSIAGSAGSAHAQPIEGKFRLGFEGGLLQHQVITTEVPANAFLPGTDGGVDEKFTAVGPGSAPVGVVLGYGLSEQFVLGAQISAHNLHYEIEGLNVSGDELTVGFRATALYVAGDGAIRPFIGPLVGMDTIGRDNSSVRLFQFGAQGGLFGFAASSFSIDPTVFFTYGLGGATQNVNDGFSSREIEADLHGFTVGLRLALSGWIGEDSSQRSTDTGPHRDLDVPSYAPPGDPSWNQPPPNAPPPQQPSYAPAAPADPGQPVYQQQPAPQPQPPAQVTPPPAPAPQSPPGKPPSQAFPVQ